MSTSRRKNSWSAPWRVFPSDALGWSIELLLAVLLLFAPLVFGAVEPWAEFVVIVLATMLGGCAAMLLTIRQDKKIVRTWAYVPMLLFIMLAGLQLVPLPARLISIISPNTVKTRDHFLKDVPGSASRLQSFPLSMYPHATRHDLRLVIAAAAIFFAVVNYYRRPAQIKRLLGCITVIGVGVCLLAFAQDVSGSVNIYFVGPHGRGTASAGPFLHYSHFSQFMNLSIGAAISLLLLMLFGKFRRRGFEVRDLAEKWRDATLRPAWPLAAFITLGVTTIFLSSSRGGMIATLLGFGLLTFALAQSRDLPGRGWLILPLVLMVFGVASFLGLDAGINRLATLRDKDHTGGRVQILKDLTHAWAMFPVVGTGLGTHEVVYPRFDRSTILERATHAEDEYAQITEEMGFVGLGLVLWFAGVLWINFTAILRSNDLASQLAGTGLGFALLAVMAHSLTDFGQHTPAVTCLTATMCGLMVAVGRICKTSPEEHSATSPQEMVSEADSRAAGPAGTKPVAEPILPTMPAVSWSHRLAFGGFSMLFTVVSAWMVIGAGKTYAAASEWKLAETKADSLASQNWPENPDAFSDILTHAGTAVQRDPDDVAHRCFLDICRWQMDKPLRQNPSPEAISDFRDDSKQILSDLDNARFECPVYGPAVFLSAEVEENSASDRRPNNDALAAYELSQTDPGACMLAALMDVRAGRWQESKTKIRRYLDLMGSFDEVVQLYVHDGGQPQLAIDLAGDDTDRLSKVAGAVRNDPRFTPLADKLDTRVFELMKRRCASNDAPAPELVQFAQLSIKRNDLPTAIDSYKRAIELNYGQVDWHLALAGLLAQSEHVPEAMHEAKICLRLRPQMPEARKLLGDLSLLPAGRDE